MLPCQEKSFVKFFVYEKNLFFVVRNTLFLDVDSGEENA